MHAAQNYIYIVFAVLYVIYSIVKAGKKNSQQKPAEQAKKPEPHQTVQPPTASPVPNMGDDFKKILEDLIGGGSEIKIPEKQKPKPEPVNIKPQPAKIITHVKNVRATPSHTPAKTKEHASLFLASEQVAKKKAFVETPIEEDREIDFDIRQAIIYSEILKRPSW